MIDLIIKHWCLAQLLATLPLQTSWTGDRSFYLVITWLVLLVNRLLPWSSLGVQNRHLSLDAGAAQNDLSQIKSFLSFHQSRNYKGFISMLGNTTEGQIHIYFYVTYYINIQHYSELKVRGHQLSLSVMSTVHQDIKFNEQRLHI